MNGAEEGREKPVFWIKGVLNGDDYVLTKDELIDVKLVPTVIKIIILIASVLPLLFIGGFWTDVAFFVPLAVYPPLIELISHHNRKKFLYQNAVDGTEISSNPHIFGGRNTKSIKWSWVDEIKFQGGWFTAIFSSPGTGTKKKKMNFKGFTRFSNAKIIADYAASTGRVKKISGKEVDWLYFILGYVLAALFFLLLLQTVFAAVLGLASVFFLCLFAVKLVRSKVVNF